ncbi:MAG: dimethylargininase [Ilumatobacteraceae bacterium]
MSKNSALVRRPSQKLAEGLVTHIERSTVDLRTAIQQWHAYVAAFADAGWTIVEAPPADSCPDGVFIEDAVVIHGDVAVITRPGHLDRRSETDGLDSVMGSLGFEVESIRSPGTLDGGDVLKVGRTVFVGRGVRTNDAGIDQLRSILGDRVDAVVPVPVERVLHLKSAVTALPDGTVIGWGPAVDDTSHYSSFIDVPEETGAHVVVLDEDTVLMAADAPRTHELVEARGYRVVTVDIGEFAKLEGCVTCLSVRMRGR